MRNERIRNRERSSERERIQGAEQYMGEQIRKDEAQLGRYHGSSKDGEIFRKDPLFNIIFGNRHS